MNLKANISLSSAQLLPLLNRSKRIIVLVVAVGLIGYTGYQISQITAVGPDEAYLTQATAKQKVPNLKSNKDTVQQLKTLHSAGDTSIPINPGKHNPFSLN